jgi:NAD(P)-dependent dehydrogenase (short-subunit alcohol dehydrogenase family)
MGEIMDERNSEFILDELGTELKNAVLIGSSGNLGPIWKDELERLGYDVYCMDVSLGYTVIDELYFDLFNMEVLQGIIPDLILYNAAIDNPPRGDVHFFKRFEDIVNVNLLGAFRAAEKWMPSMADRGSGLFIAVGSIQGYVASNWRNYDEGIRKPGGYNASKAGLMQLVRSLASEYGRNGLRACGMAFGAVDTGKLPDGEFRRKFLDCLPLQRFITEQSLRSTLRFVIDTPEFTGQTVLIDSGFTVW